MQICISKAVPRGKFIAINTYIRKVSRQRSDKSKFTPKEDRRKKITQMSRNQLYRRWKNRKVMKSNLVLWNNKIDTLIRTKEKGHKLAILGMRDLTTDPTGNGWLPRCCMLGTTSRRSIWQLKRMKCVSSLKNTKDQSSLEKKQKHREHSNINEIVAQNLPTVKTPGSDGALLNSAKYLREQ